MRWMRRGTRGSGGFATRGKGTADHADGDQRAGDHADGDPRAGVGEPFGIADRGVLTARIAVLHRAIFAAKSMRS